MKCDTDNEVPAHFYVQWSNDARTWTTMFYQPYDTELYTADNQTVTFSWASGAGYLNPRHPSATVARRGGYSYFTSGGVSSENVYREHCDDIWCWQGPGYDAARRVYVSAIPTYNLTSQYEAIAFTGHIDVDATMLPASWFTNQEGVLPSSLENNSPTHTMSSNGVEYWFYCNSKRFIVVTRSGVDEYGMSYCGFVSAFAQPDDYPFPLYIGSVTDTWSYPLSTAGTYLRDAQDPVSGAAYYRLWDNTWREVYNHDLDLGRSENWSSAPDAVIWPKHIGVVGGSNYPQNWGGDHADPEGHMLSSMDPTEQGDLPVIPSILLDRTYGAIGALDGVFTIPGGSVLSPESTFTIGADTYRVFATRSWSDGVQYYCIREV